MKRCWFGFILLVILLLGGVFSSKTLIDNQKEISTHLRQAAEAAADEDWEAAKSTLTAAREKWEKGWHFTASFADHEPMEDIDSLFAQAEIYLRSQNPEALAAVCAELVCSVDDIGEAHALNWWNLL